MEALIDSVEALSDDHDLGGCMASVVDSVGNELNAQANVVELDGMTGLAIESWGPTHRNRDYNRALDLILLRLANAGFPYINVFVISRDLLKKFPEAAARALRIDGSPHLALDTQSIRLLREAIGRAQAQMRAGPSVKGGNRTKRILLFHPLVNQDTWSEIVKGEMRTLRFGTLIHPTSDRTMFEMRVAALSKSPLSNPSGNPKPTRVNTEVMRFERDPLVAAWTLQSANGICECCGCVAPFIRSDGTGYLEVHHFIPLAEGGPDIAENALALCPTCHRRLHFGADRDALRQTVSERIHRIQVFLDGVSTSRTD